MSGTNHMYYTLCPKPDHPHYEIQTPEEFPASPYVNTARIEETNFMERRDSVSNEYTDPIHRNNPMLELTEQTGRYDRLHQEEKTKPNTRHRDCNAYLIPAVFAIIFFMILFFSVFVATTVILFSKLSEKSGVSNAPSSNNEDDLQTIDSLASKQNITPLLNHNLFLTKIGSDQFSNPVDAVISSIGLHEFFPAPSCRTIFLLNPSSPPDYYWVKSLNGSSINVFCDMSFTCGGKADGGWTKIADVNINESVECPQGFVKPWNNENLCVQERAAAGCTSLFYSTNSIRYTRICGAVEGRGLNSVDGYGFPGGNPILPVDINNWYVDGVSITRGNARRQHIWTFSSVMNNNNCHCSFNVPAFIGTDYFCLRPPGRSCDGNNPQWFFKKLALAYFDSLEIRICRDQRRSDEDIGVNSLQLYIQ